MLCYGADLSDAVIYNTELLNYCSNKNARNLKGPIKNKEELKKKLEELKVSQEKIKQIFQDEIV